MARKTENNTQPDKETKNKPVIQFRKGSISASVFVNEGEYSKMYSCNLQKSYPKEKDNDGNVTEWGNQNISLNMDKEVYDTLNVLAQLMADRVIAQE